MTQVIIDLINHTPLCMLSCIIVHVAAHKAEELIKRKTNAR